MRKSNLAYDLLKLVITILLIVVIAICVFLFKDKITETYENTGLAQEFKNTAEGAKLDFDNLKNEVSNNNVNGNDLLNSVNGSNSNNTNKTLVNTSEDMLYNQLNDTSKVIYTKIKNEVPSLDNSITSIDFGTTFNDLLHMTNGEQELNDDFQMALDAFVPDNPNLFYIDLSNVYVSTTITTVGTRKTYAVKLQKYQGNNFFSQGFENEEVRKEAISKVSNLKNQIVDSLSGTTVEKIKQVHDCLVENLSYDESLSKANGHNIYGALIERNVVCEGYAKAFKSILHSAGIPCMFVTGTGTNSIGQTETHAWNYVKMNDTWYAVDVTWDDPIISGGTGSIPDSIKYKYFLKGSDTFFNNHVEDVSRGFKYPTISQIAY